MTNTIREILCGVCKVPLKGPTEAKPHDRFSCPRCGASDTRQNVERIAGEYVTDQLAEQVSSQFANAFRGSKSVTITKSSRPKRMHRFMIDTKGII